MMPREAVADCLMKPLPTASHVSVNLDGQGRAGFGNLFTCGSVWMCPVCSGRISEERRRELNHALAWAREKAEDGRPRAVPVLLTLTARHRMGDDLYSLLSAMKDALRMFRRSRTWARLKPVLVGSITATEVTHGQHGWHPHFHVLLLLRRRSMETFDLLDEGLPAEWLRSLSKVTISGRRGSRPLDGNDHSFRWHPAEAAGAYVAKFGAAEELALGTHKTGRNGSRTWLQLLVDAGDGDAHAGHLFRIYARAFKGRRQLSWSPGLKQLVGIAELADQEIAERADEPSVLVACIPVERWRLAVLLPGSRGAILEAAERGGAEAVAQVVARLARGDPP